jgi:pimeloyl-ACP methyl ester carboxylesterase
MGRIRDDPHRGDLAAQSLTSAQPASDDVDVKSIILAMLVIACAILFFWLWTPDKDRSALESKYLAAPTDMVQLADWRLHLRVSGPPDAPAVILIHGFGSSLQTWDVWAAGLSHTHRVVRFDLPGSGLSFPDPAGDYTDARSVALVIAVMERLGLQRASIVGHSIGGRIAWTFASLHPQRVDKLVLVAPDGFASPGFAYGKPPAVPAALGLMRYVLPKPLLRMNLRPAYADQSLLNDELITRYHDLLLAPGARAAMLQRMEQTVLVDPVPMLAGIRAPTLLIWGERDAMIPIANAADYLKAIPDVRLTTVSSVGHLPQEEGPADSLDAIEKFLRPR